MNTLYSFIETCNSLQNESGMSDLNLVSVKISENLCEGCFFNQRQIIRMLFKSLLQRLLTSHANSISVKGGVEKKIANKTRFKQKRRNLNYSLHSVSFFYISK
jgi:hypothetical protein